MAVTERKEHKRACMCTLMPLLALLLAACAAPAGPAPTAPAAAPARVGFGALDFERAAYQPAIDAFNAANPDVRVEFVPLESLLAGGAADDIARRLAESADTFVSLLAGPEAAGYLADMRPLLEADATFDAADFHPGALPPGPLRVLPSTLSVQTLAYNRDLWEGAGLAAPDPAWGWADLLAAAEQLTRRQGDETLVYGIDDGQDGRIILQGLLAEAGVSLAPGADGALSLDQPAAAAALAQVVDLIGRGVIAQRPAGDGPVAFEAIGQEIRAGRVAMWIGGLPLGGPGGEGQALPFAVSDAALPAMARDNLLSSRGYAMSVGTAHPEAAWRWLSYLSAQTISFGGGVFLLGIGHDVPARRSLAAGFWEGLPPDRAAAIRATLDRADRLPPAIPEAVRGSLAAALADALKGAPAEQALARADADLSRQLLEQAARPTPAPASVQVQLPDPVVVPPNATLVRFSSFGADPATLRRLAEQFNGLDSGVFVELAPPAFGGGDFSIAALTEGLDCFEWPAPPRPEDRAALRDLQPLLDADASAEGGAPMRDDYPAALLAPFRADGRLYGLPYAVALRALTYNRDAFRAAGLEPPRPDWSLAEFLEAARRLTDRAGADPRYGYAIGGDAEADLRSFLAWQGAAPFSGAGDSLAPRFTAPEVAEAIRAYVGLLRDSSPHSSLPGYRRGSFIEAAGSMGQGGRLGMWYSGGFAGVIITIGDGPAGAAPALAVAPPPIGQGGLSGADISSSGLYIAAGSAHPEACWQWLSFLSRQAGGLGEQFPARSSVAASPAFLDQARPGAAELYAAYAEALARPDALAAPEQERRADYFWLLQAIDRALQGGDLDRELAEAQALTEQHLACVAAGETPASCAKSVDPEYAGVR